MEHYDFDRSYIRWTSSRVHHTPRLRVDAVCRLTREGRTTEFFLGALCVGETMYAERDLIQMPAYEFAMICAPGDQFMIVKLHADETLNVVESHRVGDVMSTHDGKGAPLLELSVHTARNETVRELTNCADIREAILGDRRLAGCTEYLGEDGATQVGMEYPIKVCNVSHEAENWQIDAGLVLVPDLKAPSDLLVGKMRVGYLVYNAWDWAEVVLRRLTPEGGSDRRSYFTRSTRLKVRNRLYCVDPS